MIGNDQHHNVYMAYGPIDIDNDEAHNENYENMHYFTNQPHYFLESQHGKDSKSILCQDDEYLAMNGVSDGFKLFDIKFDQQVPNGIDEIINSLSDFDEVSFIDHQNDCVYISVDEHSPSAHGGRTNSSRNENDASASNLNFEIGKSFQNQHKVAQDEEFNKIFQKNYNTNIISISESNEVNLNEIVDPESQDGENEESESSESSQFVFKIAEENKLEETKDCNLLTSKENICESELDKKWTDKIPFIANRKRKFKRRGRRTKLLTAGIGSSKETIDLSQRRDVINKTILRACRRFIISDFKKSMKKLRLAYPVKNADLFLEYCQVYADQMIKSEVVPSSRLSFYVASIIDDKLIDAKKATANGIPKGDLNRFYDTIYKYSNTKVVNLLKSQWIGEIFQYFKKQAKEDVLQKDITIAKNREVYSQIIDEFSDIFNGISWVNNIAL